MMAGPSDIPERSEQMQVPASEQRGPVRDKQSLRGGAAVTDSVLKALESLGEGLMVIELSSFLPLYVNKAFRAISGFSVDELQKLPGGLLGALQPEHRDAIRARVERRQRDEEVTGSYEFEFARKDGSTVHLEASGHLMPGDPDLLRSRPNPKG